MNEQPPACVKHAGGFLCYIERIFYASAWRDRLDSYGGKPLLYDEIGNLIRFNGNTYEWQAGKQLKRIDMRTLIGQNGVDATDGIDEANSTVIRITFSKEELH